MNIGDIRCPSCGKPMIPVRLHCTTCDLSVEGHFETDALAGLNTADQALAIAFIRNFGSIKKLQEALGVSYPTARARLEKLVEKLNRGMKMDPAQSVVIDKLDKGEITVSEALEVL
ncbi:MAG: hypothetical protein B1H09_08330 [Gemmatimonadaceae bacterium 4484_173]|nr:MAG: hypothetical protein B1H09_08330 [Gemmatimonadaceae bacterium 4484_173]